MQSLQQLFYYLKAETLSEEEAMKISGKYLAASASTLAAKILEPFALKANPSHPMLIEYLKAAYVHKETSRFECYTDSTYVNNLINASTILTNREWCSMFVGDCNISFQVFDYPEVREKYCEICNERDDVILKGQAK